MTASRNNIDKIKIRTGDLVRVLRGKDRGKKAKVVAVLTQEGRVVVEGVNMIKKHIRPRRAGEKGQRVTLAAPVNVANVQLVCPSCKRSTRIGVVRTEGVAQRVCKACGAPIPSIVRNK